jgi:hypothetical protein
MPDRFGAIDWQPDPGAMIVEARRRAGVQRVGDRDLRGDRDQTVNILR